MCAFLIVFRTFTMRIYMCLNNSLRIRARQCLIKQYNNDTKTYSPLLV